MIEPSIVEEIRWLLAQRRWQYRRIARAMGVSRGTVGRIARGEVPYDGTPELPDEDEPAGPPVRCKGCGGIVYMPCLLCRIRRRTDGRPAQRSGLWAPAEGPLRLELKGEQRLRYEEIRARRNLERGESPG